MAEKTVRMKTRALGKTLLLLILFTLSILSLAMYKVALNAVPTAASTTKFKIVWGLVTLMTATLAGIDYLFFDNMKWKILSRENRIEDQETPAQKEESHVCDV